MENELQTVNDYIKAGGIFSRVSGEDGTVTLIFSNGPEQEISTCTLTISNVEDKNVSAVVS